MVGWICPICGNVNAPWVYQCPCSASKPEITCENSDSICFCENGDGICFSDMDDEYIDFSEKIRPCNK